MHLMTQNAYGQPEPIVHERPLLFQLDHDPSEKHDLGEHHPELIAQLMEDVRHHQSMLKPAPSELEK
jgi:hypothetical protein